VERVETTLKNIISSNQDHLSEPEVTSFKYHTILSTTNSLLAVFTVWLDYKMKELLPLDPVLHKKFYNIKKKSKIYSCKKMLFYSLQIQNQCTQTLTLTLAPQPSKTSLQGKLTKVTFQWISSLKY
jgi:hypothetical protein